MAILSALKSKSKSTKSSKAPTVKPGPMNKPSDLYGNAPMSVPGKGGYPMTTTANLQAAAKKPVAAAPKKKSSGPSLSDLYSALEGLSKTLGLTGGAKQTAGAGNARGASSGRSSGGNRGGSNIGDAPFTIMRDGAPQSTTANLQRNARATPNMTPYTPNMTPYVPGKYNTNVAQDSGEPKSPAITYFESEEDDKNQVLDTQPTVVSNSSIIEDTIPDLENQLASFGGFGSSSTFGSNESSVSNNAVAAPGGGDDDGDTDIEEILGLPSKKKKKKDWSVYEGGSAAGMIPRDWWAEAYGPDAETMKALSDMQRSSDRLARSQIAEVKQKFDARQDQQQEINSRNLAQIKQVLNLGGSSRYAPISSMGLVSAQEAAGIKALATLDEEERSVLQEVESAREDRNYRAVQEKLAVIKGLRQEKMAAIKDIKESQRQAERDNQIAGLVAQGITNPVQMIQKLNSEGGDFTLTEISSALKGLNEVTGGFGLGGFKMDNKGVGQLLGSGWTAPDIQALQKDLASGASIDDILAGITDPEMKRAAFTALGVEPGTDYSALAPGPGAKSGTDEFIIRQRLFPKMAAILNKGTLSDTDREVITGTITSLRDMGLSEQQILDNFSGWSTDINTPYNGTFRDVILANDTDGQGTSPTLTRVGGLLAKGSYIPAMNAVEDMALNKHKEEEGFMGKIATETYTKRIDRIKQLLQEGTDYGDTGFVEGNFNRVLGRLKGPRSTQIRAELTQLYNTFRKENAGVAVTPSETRFLENLFADINDPKGNFVTKLDVFQQGILDRHNATRAVSSLPNVRVLDILDPNERLNLYGQSTASSFEANTSGL